MDVVYFVGIYCTLYQIITCLISNVQVRASRTESFLRDKSLLEESVLQGALAALASELVIETSPVDPEAEYKVGVAQGLLYRVGTNNIDLAFSK